MLFGFFWFALPASRAEWVAEFKDALGLAAVIVALIVCAFLGAVSDRQATRIKELEEKQHNKPRPGSSA